MSNVNKNCSIPSIVNPDSKAASVIENGRTSAQDGVSTEKTVPGPNEIKSSTTTSAFQRLVMASKKMVMKKSSEKKDCVNKLHVVAM